MLFSMEIRDILIILPLLLMSLSIHEYAHARVSTALGDPTPGIQGRLTLNPMAHLTPIGTLLLLVAGFGWAKPVIIDMRYYKKPNLGLVLTSLAGPMANFAVAVLLLLLLKALLVLPLSNTPLMSSLLVVLQQAASVNLLLFIFNILPIPPLDGSRLVNAVLLHKRPDLSIPYNRYGAYLLIFVIFTDRFLPVDIFPLGRWTAGLFNSLAETIL